MAYEYLETLANIGYGIYQSEQAKSYGEEAAKATREAAEANARISRYDAEVARQTAVEIHKKNVYDMEQQMRKMAVILSSQRAGYASKGVVTSTGSALDVQIDSYRRGMEDLKMLDYEGRKAENQAKNLAQRYEMLAEAGLKDAAAQAALIEDAYNQRAMNYLLTGTARAAKSTYRAGRHEGWW